MLACQMSLALDALLTGDGLTTALAGACVRTSALTADGKTAAVTIAAIAADVLETLNVLAHLAAERTLNEVGRVNDGGDLGELLLVDLAGAQVGVCLLYTSPSPRD